MTLEDLLADLQGMRPPLQSGDLESVQRLLIQHDRKVREFMHSPAGRAASYAQLAALLRAQRDLERSLRQARDEAAGLMHASDKADRAARAYLANAEA